VGRSAGRWLYDDEGELLAGFGERFRQRLDVLVDAFQQDYKLCWLNSLI
jgi:hypothetical protein